MSREEARTAIDTADQWLANDPVAIATVAQAKTTFYLAEQVGRLADMVSSGFFIERADYGHSVAPMERS